MLFWAVVKRCYVVYGLIQEKGGDGEGEQAQEWSDLNSSYSDETYDNWNLSRFLITLFRLLSKFPCD